MIRDPFAVFVALALIVWVSVWLEENVRGVRYVGSVLTAILLATVVANLGMLPSSSPTYGMLGGLGVSVGIALVLMGVDVKSVIRAGPKMLAAFGLGATGTAVGAIVGGLFLSGAVGPETWKLAGQYTGTYTGGSVNFVSVGRAVETSPDLYSAAIAADNVTTMLWMAACLALPAILGPWWPGSRDPKKGSGAGVGSGSADLPGEVVAFNQSKRAVTVRDMSMIVGIVVTAVLFTDWLGTAIPGIPSVLWLTTIMLAVAQAPFVRRLSGAPMLGNYVLHLFLATIGAQSIFAEIMRAGPAVFYFTLVVVGVHGLVVFGAGRVLGLSLPTLVVASQANVGGPASAMALATSKGYADRVLPGVAVGLLGYAVGNYTGLLVAGVVRSVLGS